MASRQSAHDLLGSITQDSKRFQVAQPEALFNSDFLYKFKFPSLPALSAFVQVLLRIAILICILAIYYRDLEGYSIVWLLIGLEVALYHGLSKRCLFSQRVLEVKDADGVVTYFLDQDSQRDSAPVGESIFWGFQLLFFVCQLVLSVTYLFSNRLLWGSQTLLLLLYWGHQTAVYFKKRSLVPTGHQNQTSSSADLDHSPYVMPA